MATHVTNALLNFILVSVPEELFLVTMTLILMKRFDLLDVRMWWYNLKWIMLPVIPVALLINFFKYIVVIDKQYIMLISLPLLYILILCLGKNNIFRHSGMLYLRLLLCLAISVFIMNMLENLTCPVILDLINQPLGKFENNILWNFALSIPSRIIAYLLLAYIIIKNNSVANIKILTVILKNSLYSKLILFLVVSSNMLSIYMIELISVDNILDKVPLIEKIFISESLLVLPLVVIFVVILLIGDLAKKERIMCQSYKNLVDQNASTIDDEDDD